VKNYIKNADRLLSHGNRRLRELVLQMINAALEAANPYHSAKKLIHLSGDQLCVGSSTYDLTNQGKIYVVGAGKASFPIALALEEILGDRITEGLIVVKDGQEGSLRRIRVLQASHPIPDLRGLNASRRMMQLASKIKEGDIVFACITGGSSALLPMPVSPITLQEKKRVNRLLLSCGASIFEINAVRKHLSKIKGGRLGLALFPGELINLTVSDVIGDALDYITDPTVPDTSSFDDALRTLYKYSLIDKIPPSVRNHIEHALPSQETPKSYGTRCYQNFILADNNSACKAVRSLANSLGFKATILSTMFDGESREVGHTFAAIAKEIIKSNRPFERPCVLIGGGETVVTLNKNFGKGGPNSEFTVSSILKMDEENNFLVAGFDTDGTDGPTDIGGAIGDDSSLQRAKEKGLDLHKSLMNHDVIVPLNCMDDIILTGSTGTNVNDLKLLILE